MYIYVRIPYTRVDIKERGEIYQGDTSIEPMQYNACTVIMRFDVFAK